MKRLFIGFVIVIAVAGTGIAAYVALMPRALPGQRPAIEPVPPLAAATRTSTILVPTRIALATIQDAVNAGAPQTEAGQRDNPLRGILQGALTWRIERGPIVVAGENDGLTLSAPLTGQARLQGQIGGAASSGEVGAVVGNLLRQNLPRLQNVRIDQQADIRGAVSATARPQLTANWRIAPNLTVQASVNEASIPLAGMRVSIPGEVQPHVNRVIAGEVAKLDARLANDPFFEAAARRTWGEICRSMRLPSTGPGSAPLFLEVKPTAALAAQPRITREAVELVIGLRAETRVLGEETRPDCPFPARLDLVPRPEAGQVALAMPIDVPFSELDRLLTNQLVGRTFPQDGSGPVLVTVRGISLTPSGQRLLVGLTFDARETRLFGLSVSGVMYLWGRPVLDAAAQVLRFADIEIDVRSEAAFGLFGAAAAAARPYIERVIAERAVVDLKPFAAEARTRLDQGIAQMNAQRRDAAVELEVTALRLAEIAFDARVLRVVAEAEGTVALGVTALPVR
jgi:hypothetical protein